MKRIFNTNTAKHVGKKVKVAGWINNRRTHGKIIFVDLRDKTGIIQIVFTDPLPTTAILAIILNQIFNLNVVFKKLFTK